MKNPTILQLSSRDNDYTDYEFKVADIAAYYIVPAHELAARQVSFNADVADDELVLVIIFKDGTHKGFSLARQSMSFLY